MSVRPSMSYPTQLAKRSGSGASSLQRSGQCCRAWVRIRRLSRSRASWARTIASIAAQCSTSSVIASRGIASASRAGAELPDAAWASAADCALLSKKVGCAVNTTCPIGRDQRAANASKSPPSSSVVKRCSLSAMSTGPTRRFNRPARAIKASPSSSRTSASIAARLRSPSSIWRDSSSPSWNTGLNSGVSIVR